MTDYTKQQIMAAYQRLLKSVDSFFKRFQQDYADEMSCEAGCSQCCSLTSVFPLEARFINLYWQKHRRGKFLSSESKTDMCPFLHKQQCLIYAVRPLICRTHGLVLATIEDNSLSWDSCALNFPSGLPEIFDRNDFFAVESATEHLVNLNIVFCQLSGIEHSARRIILQDIYTGKEPLFHEEE